MREPRPHHLLSIWCLDAPLIALGWGLLLDRSRAGAPWHHWLALFLAVWAIYLADRLLDISRPVVPATPRHRGAARWRQPLAILLAGVALAGLLLMTQFDRALWTRGGLLVGLVLLYFAGFRAWRPRSGPLPLKEIMIGLTFALGIAAASSRPLVDLALPVAAMAFLFTGNCLLIARAERGIDALSDPASFYATLDRPGRWPEACFAVALMVGGAGFVAFPSGFLIALSGAALASILMALRERRGRIVEVQVVADGILLLPWLPLLWGFLEKTRGG